MSTLSDLFDNFKLNYIRKMQKNLYIVEWLNKFIRVTVVNGTSTEEDPVAVEQALLKYLRRLVFELSPKFEEEQANLQFLL